MGLMGPIGHQTCCDSMQQGHKGYEAHLAEYNVGCYVALQKFPSLVACCLTYQKQHGRVERAAELHKTESVGNIKNVNSYIEDR